MSRTRFRALAYLATAALTASLAATIPAAASAPTWTAPATITGGDPTGAAQAIPDPLGGTLLYYTDTGVPALRYVSSTGALGAEIDVPAYLSLGNHGTPGNVAFLANGSAIVTWTLAVYGTDYMAYLSPNGTWGAPVEAQGVEVAVRTGEVLTSEPGGTGVTVDDWALSSSGVLTHDSGFPESVFTGTPRFGNSSIALDADGSAVVVTWAYTAADGFEEVYAISRTNTGTWGSTPQDLSGSTVGVAVMSFAAAPGGRAIVVWENQASISQVTLSASVHGSTGGFGAPVPLNTLDTSSVPARSDLIPVAAAGTDGTLALGITEHIGNGPYGGDYTAANFVRTVPKTSTTIGGAQGVTAVPAKSDFSSLGVGDGQVIAGISDEVDGQAPGNAAYPSSYTATVSTYAVLVPATGSQVLTSFGSISGLYDGNGSEGCSPSPCSGTSPPRASVAGVALDTSGTAVALGQLSPGGGLSYADRLAPKPVVPVVKISTTKAKAGKKTVSLKVACSKATCKGTLLLTHTVHKKLVVLASHKYSLKAGKGHGFSLKLTAKGKKAFKHASKKHPVKVKAYAGVTGGKTASKTVKIT